MIERRCYKTPMSLNSSTLMKWKKSLKTQIDRNHFKKKTAGVGYIC